MKVNRIFNSCMLFFLTSALFAQAPDWLMPLTNAVYEQVLSSSEVFPIYNTAKAKADAIVSEHERYVVLGRCENLMGIAFEREGKKKEAIAYYEQGEALAKSALELQTTSQALFLQAQSISLLCDAKGFFYQAANGTRFLNIANQAIDLDEKNYEAKNILAICYTIAPPPVRNLNRAESLLSYVLANNDEDIPKEILFNGYCSLALLYEKQRKTEDAKAMYSKALVLYPTNNDVQKILEKYNK